MMWNELNAQRPESQPQASAAAMNSARLPVTPGS